MKKIIIVVACAIVAVAAAVASVFVLLEFFKADEVLSEISSVSDVVDTFAESEIESVPESSQEEPVEIGLVLTSPKSAKTNTTSPNITFTGTSDPEGELTLNGNAVERDSKGAFSFEVNLNIGNNTFNFLHKGLTYTYTVHYRYVVMNYFTPQKAEKFDNGAIMPVTVTARKGSVVTATFCGNTIELTPSEAQTNEEFIYYGGSFQLPSGGITDVNLGAVTFTATYNGISESFRSGNITCRKPETIKDSNPAVTPTGGRYIDVGSGIIAEVISYEAETFDAYSTNDQSKPTNNYLPKGTVDYCSSKYVYTKSGEKKEYAVLRFGKQVYTKRKNVPTNEIIPVIKQYEGVLPDHNEISIASFQNGTSHTTLTLNTMWKAPFYFELLNQSFVNAAKNDYNYTTATYSYVDITLCYATVLTGELIIPEDNPVFKSAEIIKNNSDYTLRLHLKRTGQFYGWDANYNSEGQLVFEFLNPAKISVAANDYGVDLTGARILIDVGHGGKDSGALGSNNAYTEAVCNLLLAQKVKAELESIGATVYMTRDSNITSSNDTKIKMLKDLKPDYCISIHHNSNKSSSPYGFSAHFSQFFAKKAAELVWSNTVNASLYRKYDFKWHYYYMARSSYCPVVLTENGYMSNAEDYSHITNDEYNTSKAKAIARGIAQYFLSIQ